MGGLGCVGKAGWVNNSIIILRFTRGACLNTLIKLLLRWVR